MFFFNKEDTWFNNDMDTFQVKIHTIDSLSQYVVHISWSLRRRKLDARGLGQARGALVHVLLQRPRLLEQ